jgi:L-fucono-1,5-lactonase
MQRIDSHQHFWRFDPVRDAWITEEMSVIRHDFLPDDLRPILDAQGFDGSVAVQADQSDAETQFLLDLADKNDWIKGVVGWVDFQSDDIVEKLSQYSRFGKLKGFRHILQGERQRDFMLRPAFLNGIGKLLAFGFTYDILIFPDQLEFTETFVHKFPDQPFVIDHLAKPYILDKKVEPWKTNIQRLANLDNVYCKISGMVTEDNWKTWKKEDFTPYLDAVVGAFGTGRVLYGSDWPVCLVASSYSDMIGIVTDYFSALSRTEQENVFGGNATKFYNL